MLLGPDEDYALLINVGIAVLVASMVAGVMPALRQDKLARNRA